MSGSTSVPTQGTRDVDGLLSLVRWTDPVITFGSPSLRSEYTPYVLRRSVDDDDNPATPNWVGNVDESAGFTPLNADQDAAMRAAMQAVRDVTLLRLLEVDPAASADIRLGMSTTRSPGSTTAYAYEPSNNGWGGDIWFNPTDYNMPLLGTYAYQTFFHEIGHALGLKHGHEGEPGNANTLTTDHDSLEYSTMTYRAFVGHGAGGYGIAAGHYPQSYMMLDIQALQYMYGADFEVNSGATTYGFSPTTGEMFVNGAGQGIPRIGPLPIDQINVLFRTIWDGGGYDTYDFSTYDATRQLNIDLAPGGFTDVDRDTDFQAANLRGGGYGIDDRHARGQVFNALQSGGDGRSLIERALGGAGDDSISGNQTGNELIGNAGNDTLLGLDGNDQLTQGLGGGGSYGGNGDDTLYAGSGAETLDGGAGYDRLDYLYSTAGVQVSTSVGKLTGGGWASGDTVVNIEALYGGGFDDYLWTDDAPNTLLGRAGNDTLYGVGGTDVLYGDDGNDLLLGGAAGDYLDGGAGTDTASYIGATLINLSNGAHGGEAAGDLFTSIERYLGGDASDTMIAAGAGAWFGGGAGTDYLYGGNGADTLQGGRGGDVLNGGGSLDIASYADAPEGITAQLFLNDGTTDGKITAGAWGSDTLTSIEAVEGSAFNDGLYGDLRANRLIGGAGDDTIAGGPGEDLLEAGAGNDRVFVDADDFSADGGDGIDTLEFEGATSVNLDFRTGNAYVSGQLMLLTSFEVVGGTGGNDAIVGTDAKAESFSGGTGGRDTLYGLGSSDTLIGGDDDDYLDGGDGDDTIYADAGTDTLVGGNGYDRVLFLTATIADWQAGVLDASIASDSWYSWEAIQGSAGDDRIRTNSWGFAVELGGGDGRDTLASGDSGDRLHGDAGSDTVEGSGGADLLEGGTGDDLVADFRQYRGGGWRNGDGDALFGGDGNDTLASGGGDDLIDGAGGIDLLRMLLSDATEALSFAIGVRPSLAFDVRLGAGRAAQVLNVDALDIAGGTRGDRMDASRGATRDTLDGGIADDTLLAGGGDDLLLGGGGIDSLVGGAGRDTLVGGLREDRLTGGTGVDAFRYLVTADGGDTIFDFNGADDRLEFSAVGFRGGLTAGMRLGVEGRFEEGGAPTAARGQFLYTEATGRLFWDDDGTGGHGAVLIAKLVPGTALDPTDLVVIA